MQGYVKVMRLEWKLRWLERAMIEETKPIPWLQNLRIGCWCLCVLLRKYMLGTCVLWRDLFGLVLELLKGEKV